MRSELSSRRVQSVREPPELGCIPAEESANKYFNEWLEDLSELQNSVIGEAVTTSGSRWTARMKGDGANSVPGFKAFLIPSRQHPVTVLEI